MQFNRSGGQKYSMKLHREPEGNTLEIVIRQKDVTASELNVHVKKFTDENKIDDLTSNAMQLVTEELVVMVLLQMLQPDAEIQYMISHDRKNGTVRMGLGYPGAAYNPFDQEDNIFMINVFKQWISDIQFENADNSFNELVLTMQGEVNQEDFDLEELAEETAESEPGQEPVLAANKDTFDYLGYEVGNGQVKPGEIAQNFRQSEAYTWEIIIRDKEIDGNLWYQHLDKFLKQIDIEKSRIIFDTKVNTAEGVIKSVSKVLLFDILEHCKKTFTYVACKANYIKGEGEFVLQIQYPGEDYNPFVKNADDRGIRIISRQTTITTHCQYKYKNRKNELTANFRFVK